MGRRVMRGRGEDEVGSRKLDASCKKTGEWRQGERALEGRVGRGSNGAMVREAR